MKLIIDIPDDTYERVMNPDKFYRDIDGEKIRWAVYKGTPIHNVTNGDVIKAMFPNGKYNEYFADVEMKTEENDTRFKSVFDRDWWDEPYQKGGKE